MLAGLVYLLFFLSGAAALAYQVVWVRSLTLVFGDSHLAVTAVLSVFMGGLGLGGYLVGRLVDRIDRPLRLYAWLELGIAPAALLFAGLLRLYPAIYASLAQGRDDSTLYLTTIRVLFSAVALIVPTTLIGGTLPVLARFLARQPENLRHHLSFLYAFNTLGAVLGALLASFVFIRLYSVSLTLYLAVATNVLIGAVSLAVQRRLDRSTRSADAAPLQTAMPPSDTHGNLGPIRWVLWGIGFSGFCALGYEVLWTRVLALAVGVSIYSFTIVLVAFLTGIALGSHGYGLLVRLFGRTRPETQRVVAWFGGTQVLIGITALIVTVSLRHISGNTVRLQDSLLESGTAGFQARVWISFVLAFLYMVVPALFMGAAFPIAGEAVARWRQATGRAVGDVLAANTVGAILGAAVSGLFLIRVFGIETSLEMLTVLNVGMGLVVLASLRSARWLAGAAALTLAGVGYLAWNPNTVGAWDRNYLALFRSSHPEALRTPEMEAADNTDVLYYAEGNEAIVSVIRVKGGQQEFILNGRVEASSHVQAQQLQLTLGLLPVLLARDPKDVLVVGLGSGMTAGATAVSPSVKSVTIVEIERQVIGATKTFDAFNHHVLDDPKVELVVNDGRNFLMTTNQSFDVITADPIHPSLKGAGSLYASEYFALAASHLRPGGVIAQWLPIYELTAADLASAVRTFQRHFPNTLLWLTQYDAVMVGSRLPFQLDEAELQRRMAEPAVASDLEKIAMRSPADLLGYFVMGTEGMKRFAMNGIVNTDDRPYLEYSAPFSIANAEVTAANVGALSAQRESILPYLKAAAEPGARQAQEERWENQRAAGQMGDRALALLVGQGPTDPSFSMAMRQLTLEHPTYAPGLALLREHETAVAMEPRLLARETFHLLGDSGAIFKELSVVLVPVSKTRAAVMFVDNRSRTVYGQAYMDDYERDERAARFASDVMATVRTAYEELASAAKEQNGGLPSATAALQSIVAIINAKVKNVQSGS